MASYNSIAELVSAVKQATNDTLANEIATKSKETFHDNILSDVYAVCNGATGAFGNYSNIYTELIGDCQLEMSNITGANASVFGYPVPGYGETTFSSWLNDGINNKISWLQSPWMSGTHFIEHTVNLLNGGVLVSALRQGMSRHGFTVL